jgi:small-conductance mechanosensitive channel
MSGWTESAISRLALLMRTLTDVVIVSLAALVLIGMWTDVLFDTSSIFTAARDGFQIGEFSVSPAALAIGFLVLLIGIILTRSVTDWLDRRVLSDTQLDSGARNSIHSGARYAGYALAAVVALTATGLDLSSLTIAAGALGLGIGFGLQSIANNFVSGLILLAERPVRVGDWVATNAGEGIVKKINVRSTEIETFDNCTIIVPNSNLISEAVRNWTHRDTVGRFTVSVSVVHGSDAKSVAKKLLALAHAHPKVMRHPAPTVHLSRIAPQSLDFDLRGYTQHVFDAVNISSDLRIAITEELPSKALLLAPPAAPILRRKPS